MHIILCTFLLAIWIHFQHRIDTIDRNAHVMLQVLQIVIVVDLKFLLHACASHPPSYSWKLQGCLVPLAIVRSNKRIMITTRYLF